MKNVMLLYLILLFANFSVAQTTQMEMMWPQERMVFQRDKTNKGVIEIMPTPNFKPVELILSLNI